MALQQQLLPTILTAATTASVTSRRCCCRAVGIAATAASFCCKCCCKEPVQAGNHFQQTCIPRNEHAHVSAWGLCSWKQTATLRLYALNSTTDHNQPGVGQLSCNKLLSTPVMMQLPMLSCH